MKQYVVKAYLLLGGMAALVVIVDQWSKFLIRANLQVGEIWSPWAWLTPYARIVHWYNTGVAFGLFQDHGQLFSVLKIAVSIAIIFYFPRVPVSDWPLRLAMGFQLGGALGNLVDRILLGHVTDFISVGSFPVFNVADASITMGVAILIVGVWIQERQKKKTETAQKRRLPGGDSEIAGKPFIE